MRTPGIAQALDRFQQLRHGHFSKILEAVENHPLISVQIIHIEFGRYIPEFGMVPSGILNAATPNPTDLEPRSHYNYC